MSETTLETANFEVAEAYVQLEQTASRPYSLFVYGTPQVAHEVAVHLFRTAGCEFSPPYGRMLRTPMGEVQAIAAWLSGLELIKARLRATMALLRLAILREHPTILERIRLASSCLIATQEHDMYLSRLAVSEKMRERGIGSFLLQSCAAEAKASGKQRIVLEVAPESDAAVRLYKRHGFQEIACHNTVDPATNTTLNYLHMALKLDCV